MNEETSAGRRPLSRREFLEVTAAATGGLLVACRSTPSLVAHPAAADSAAPAPRETVPANGVFNVYLELTPDNEVFITNPQTEMGQGVHDALAKIIADELDADWARVTVRAPYFDEGFINPVTKRQRTANSESVTVYFELLRKLGATARGALIEAAALRWNVPPEECSTRPSEVVHVATGRRLGYGELAAAAAALAVATPARNPRLKAPADWRLIGTATPRKDTPAKCDGSAIYGIDVRLPGMVYAALCRSPAVDAKLIDFDRAAVLGLPGVIDAFAIPDGVAVIADSTWRARRAAERVQARFDSSRSAGVEQKKIRERMRAALADDASALPARSFPPAPPPDRAGMEAALAGAAKRVEFEYEVPFLAHAALEPLCCTAYVHEGGCEIWAPSQNPDQAHAAAMQITGLPRERVRFNVTFVGGGFGRKWDNDFVIQAVQIAKAVPGRPVKLTWTREQDFEHDRYRPAHRVRTRVGLGADSSVAAIHSRIAGISMWKYQGRPAAPGFGDLFATGALIDPHYRFPHTYIDFAETDLPIPVGTWRSVSLSMNGFFSESAVDEIAAITRQDPYRFRRELLAHDPRAVAVLDLVAEKSGWGGPLPKGRGRGIAITFGFASICAQVVEVTVAKGKLKVDRIVCAFDCGTIVDPRNVEAQIEGGMVFGLSAALNGEVSFADGGAEQHNFDTGPLLRFQECPRFEVYAVSSTEKPSGAGELSVPPVAPALTAAIHAASGRRIRRLPVLGAGLVLG
jgi:CO/xanthine dehydrogenase Mo-binding subunit